MKTIFVNLFFGYAVDNLSIPGGVIDQLVKRKPKNVRVVLLAPKVFDDQLKPFILDKSVLVERLDKFGPTTMLQKLFHFFYSYLIFTDTTRILATFGARADTPPLDRNRHVAWIKSFIANTFGRFDFIKYKATPWLFLKIFRGRPYKELFDKYEPDLLFLTNIAFFPDIELLAEAKRRGVGTVGMASNWDHLNKYFIPLHADHLIVQNDPMKKEAVFLHGYREEEVTVTGFPQFDFYFEPEKFLIGKKDVFDKFGIPGNSGKLIVFISGAAYSLDEPDIIGRIGEWIRDGELGQNVAFLLRPYVTGREKKVEEDKYERFKGDRFIKFNKLKNEGSFENKRYYMSMLYHADVVIAVFSTSAIEAAIFDKPLISIGFDGDKKRPFHESIVRLEKMSHFRHVLDTGSVRIARSFDDLLRFIKDYFVHPENDSAPRKLMVEKMCYKTDGKSSERIVDLLLSKIYG